MQICQIFTLSIFPIFDLVTVIYNAADTCQQLTAVKLWTMLLQRIVGLTLVCVVAMVFSSIEVPLDDSIPYEKSQDMTKSK